MPIVSSLACTGARQSKHHFSCAQKVSKVLQQGEFALVLSRALTQTSALQDGNPNQDQSAGVSTLFVSQVCSLSSVSELSSTSRTGDSRELRPM